MSDTLVRTTGGGISIPTRPITTVRSSGNITAAITAAWADLDDTGSASSRDLDCVLPNMSIGSKFDFRPVFSSSSANASFLGNVAVILDGAVVRRCFDATLGFLPWAMSANVAAQLNCRCPIQTVQSGDLSSNGSLRLRFQYILATNTRVMTAAPSSPMWMEARGPLV